MLFRSETLSVATGEEALEKIKGFSPDLVLLDVMMPGIDGLETCRRMRADPDLRGLKIVMLSARSADSDIQAGMQAGADDYITKPFDVVALRKYVEDLLAD